MTLTFAQIRMLCQRSKWFQLRMDISKHRDNVIVTLPIVDQIAEQDMKVFIEELSMPYTEYSIILHQLGMAKTVILAHAFQATKVFQYCNTIYSMANPNKTAAYMQTVKTVVGQHNDVPWDYALEVTDQYPILSAGILVNVPPKQIEELMRCYDVIMMHLSGYTEKNCIYCARPCRYHRQEDLTHPRSPLARTKCCDAIMHAGCATDNAEDSCPICKTKLRNSYPIETTYLQEIARALHKEYLPHRVPRTQVRTQLRTKPKPQQRNVMTNTSGDESCTPQLRTKTTNTTNDDLCNPRQQTIRLTASADEAFPSSRTTSPSEMSTRARRNSMPETYL